MVELDDATRRALLSREAPPPGAEQRVLAALRTRLIPPTDGGPGSGLESTPTTDGGLSLGGSGAGGSTSGWIAHAAKIVTATIGMTSAGLLVVTVVGRAIVGEPSASNPSVPRAELIDHEHDRDRDHAASAPIEAPAEQVDEVAAPALTPTPAPASPSKPAKPAPADSMATPASTLEAELALLRAAKAAGSPTDALVSLEQHRRDFPHGILADERDALRIDSLCALDRRTEARSAAKRFLAERPDSPLRARVRDACR